MDNQRNLLTVDFANNKDLKALMQSWAVGEEYELSLKLQLNELTADGAKFSIKEVTSKDMEEPKDAAIEPAQAEPVMMVMRAGVGTGPAAAPTPYVAA